MEYTEVFENVSLQNVKREFTQKDFIRDTMIKLSANKGTPVDILSGEFSEVEENEDEYVVASTNVSIDYSCMIGTDRKEEYWDKEKYTENGITKYRDVKKTRTVTDWSPFSGKNSSQELVVTANRLSESTKNAYITASVLRACKKESFENLGTANVNKPALAGIQAAGEYQCFKRVNLPGDHQKDEHYSGSVEVTGANLVIFPSFSATYTYNGNRYTAASCASGILSSNCTYPSDIDNVRKQAKKKARPFLIAAPVALVLAIVLAIFAATLGFWYIIPFLGSIGLLITYFVMVNKFYNKMTNQRMEEKKNRLVRKLRSMDMQELSPDELSLLGK